MLYLILILVALYLLYKKLTSNFDYFEKLNIPYVKPVIFFGSFYKSVIKKESLRESFISAYNKYKNYKVFGIFDGSTPIYVINDLDLIKQVTVKDSDHFRNHRMFVDVEDDPLTGNSLFSLENDKWHDMRTTLSPAFTGSKMRLMHHLINNTSEKAVKYLKTNVKNSSDHKSFDIEVKDFFLLFSNDIIASVAFGLDVNSLEDKNSKFLELAKSFITFDTWTTIKFITYNSFKSIFRILGIKMFKEEFNNYFIRLVVDSMKYRKENNIIRQDMINMLMEARANPDKSHNREWTDEELVAQCTIFLFAGLESVSTTLCFASQELIENYDVQAKLIEEIDSVNEELNGKPITYDIIKKMKYMDMFVSEVLRKWPPFVQNDRKVNKPYQIQDGNNKIILSSGDIVWIPVVGVQMDEEYFPKPYKFDPERFSEENKDNIKPYSYIPFGSGPRMCIGSRLALLEVKTILFYILSNFKFEVCEKSTVPAVLEPCNFPITLKNGFWLKMVSRR